MIEAVTVHMTKDVSRLLSEEIAFLNLTGKVSRAEFAGTLLGDALLSVRAAREAVKAAPQVVDGAYVGGRTPVR